MSNNKIHLDLIEAVRNEKSATIKVLNLLKEVDKRKLFVDHGHPSLMKYMVRELGYTEAESWTRIQAMKLINDLPEFKKKIEEGNMGLSNAATLLETLRKNESNHNKIPKTEIIQKALDHADLPARPFKKLLMPEIKEKRILLNERLLNKMEKIIGQMSETELIEALVDEKLKMIELSKGHRTSKKPCENSRYIPKSVQRIVYHRANHQCEYVGKNGIRCQERRNLQKDHIQPFALGGDNSESNIRLLCSGHNQARARKTFNHSKIN